MTAKATAAARVAVVMGSDSDWEVMSRAAARLEALKVPYEVTIASAHRSPERTAAYAAGARERGIAVFIAGAGAAAHLAGAIAAHTTLPAIGVPLASTDLGGLDALLSTAQMPAGVPVATVSVGEPGAENAAVLAAQILALGDRALAGRLARFKEDLAADVQEKDKRLKAKLAR